MRRASHGDQQLNSMPPIVVVSARIQTARPRGKCTPQVRGIHAVEGMPVISTYQKLRQTGYGPTSRAGGKFGANRQANSWGGDMAQV